MTAAPIPAMPSVTAALARMAAIQTRFAPQSFAGVLRQALPDTGAAQASAAPARAGVPGDLTFRAPAATGGLAAAPAVAGGQHSGEPWAARLPERGRAWAAAIAEAAGAAGVDPALLAALVWAESAFDAGAVSHAGARGLAQLMPATARGLGVDIDDPAANLLGGARYLRAQLDRFGSVELALAAYNAGPARVAQAGGVPAIAETRAYVPRVLAHHARLQGAS